MTKKFVIFIFSLALAIGLVSARPLVINADASDGEFDNDSVVGVQIQENEELLSGVQGTRYTFNIILDGFYIGDFQIHVEYDSYNVSSGNWDHYNIDRTVYVCGYDTYFETWMRENWLPPSSITWSASVNNSDQCIYVGRMDSSQLLNTLIQFKNTYSSNSTVTNGFLNQIDQKIDNLLAMRQYNIPVESLPWNDFLMNNISHMPLNATKINYFDYPVYYFSSGQQFHRDTDLGTNGNQVIYFVFISSSYITQSVASTLFNDSNIELTLYEITDFSKPYFRYTFGYKLNYTNTSVGKFYLTREVRDVIPLFSKVLGSWFNIKDYVLPITSDFALITGLNNQMLNDIHVIAQGTQASNNSSSDLEDSSSNFSTSANTMFNYEDTFNDNLTDSLDDINTNFSFDTNFGSNFLNSAQFVKQQYDLLTGNNAFGSLLAFSLLLGLGLLILGKVL